MSMLPKNFFLDIFSLGAPSRFKFLYYRRGFIQISKSIVFLGGGEIG